MVASVRAANPSFQELLNGTNANGTPIQFGGPVIQSSSVSNSLGAVGAASISTTGGVFTPYNIAYTFRNISTRVGSPYISIGASQTCGTLRTRHVAPSATDGLQLCYATLTTSLTRWETNLTLTTGEVMAAIETPKGVLVPATFFGKRVGVMTAGNILVSDPVGVHLNPGEVYWIRSYQNQLISSNFQSVVNGEFGNLSTNSGVWIQNSLINTNYGEGYNVSSSTGINPFTFDKTLAASGSFTINQTVGGLIPFCILGRCAAAPSISLTGDSLEVTGWSIYIYSNQPNMFFGAMDYALGTNAIPRISTSVGGDSTTNWLYGQAAMRWTYATANTYFVDQLGENDLNNGETALQLEAFKLQFWNSLVPLGIKIYASTVGPRSTSTDNWETTVNQTTQSPYNAQRVIFNNWVRGNPSPITGCFDYADFCETSRDSGIWKAPNATGDTGTASGGVAAPFGHLYDNTKSWTTNQWAGQLVRDTTSGKVGIITGNTSTNLTVFISTWTDPTGHPYRIYSGQTYDGVHPSPVGITNQSQAINISVFK